MHTNRVGDLSPSASRERISVLRLSFSRKQQLQHIPDVGGPRWISKHRRLQIRRRQTVTDRDGEKVDDLFGMGPDEVSAQDAIGILLDEGLEAVDGFIESHGCVPVTTREFKSLQSNSLRNGTGNFQTRIRECFSRNREFGHLPTIPPPMRRCKRPLFAH